MEIIKQGFKQAAGKIYLECKECGCEYTASDEDFFDKDEKNLYTSYHVKCPCCGELWRIYSNEYDDLHAKYIEKLKSLDYVYLQRKKR